MPFESSSAIYIVDDDASVRRALRRWVRSIGLDAQTFASPDEFLRSDYREGASCLILDVRMPGMGGLELQERLVRENCTIPTVFITAHDDAEEQARALEAGARGFLRKPFDDTTLIDVIQRAMA